MEQNLRPRKDPVPFLEHPVIIFLTRVMDVLILSILWILCSIPLVTIGASTAALYHTTLKLARGEAVKTARTFFKGFALHWKQASLALPVLVIILAIALGDYIVLQSGLLPMPSKWFTVIFAIPIPLALLFCGYVLPTVANYQDKLRVTFVKAAAALIRNIFLAILVMVLNWFALVWFLAWPDSFMQWSIYIIFFAPGGAAYINSLFLSRLYDKHIGPSAFADDCEDNL